MYLNSSVIISCLVSCVQRLSLPPRSLCRTSPCSEPWVLIHCTSLSVLLFLNIYCRYSSTSISLSSTDMVNITMRLQIHIPYFFTIQSDILTVGVECKYMYLVHADVKQKWTHFFIILVHVLIKYWKHCHTEWITKNFIYSLDTSIPDLWLQPPTEWAPLSPGSSAAPSPEEHRGS